jgi:hypothetical protein
VFPGGGYCGASQVVKALRFDQLGFKLTKHGHDIGLVRVECGPVGSHDAAQVVAHFWDRPALRGDKMKHESAKHPEPGGG